MSFVKSLVRTLPPSCVETLQPYVNPELYESIQKSTQELSNLQTKEQELSKELEIQGTKARDLWDQVLHVENEYRRYCDVSRDKNEMKKDLDAYMDYDQPIPLQSPPASPPEEDRLFWKFSKELLRSKTDLNWVRFTWEIVSQEVRDALIKSVTTLAGYRFHHVGGTLGSKDARYIQENLQTGSLRALVPHLLTEDDLLLNANDNKISYFKSRIVTEISDQVNHKWIQLLVNAQFSGFEKIVKIYAFTNQSTTAYHEFGRLTGTEMEDVFLVPENWGGLPPTQKLLDHGYSFVDCQQPAFARFSNKLGLSITRAKSCKYAFLFRVLSGRYIALPYEQVNGYKRPPMGYHSIKAYSQDGYCVLIFDDRQILLSHVIELEGSGTGS